MGLEPIAYLGVFVVLGGVFSLFLLDVKKENLYVLFSWSIFAVLTLIVWELLAGNKLVDILGMSYASRSWVGLVPHYGLLFGSLIAIIYRRIKGLE